ncbi:hypothetical protein Tco_0455933 [Tanacetum coccineum]
MMKESHPKEIEMTRMTKVKENASNVEIQIISLENAQNYQETIIKEPTSEDHGVIATKKEKKRLRMNNVLWLKHLMRIEKGKEANEECKICQDLRIENEKLKEEISKLNQFNNSNHSLKKTLNLQKPSEDKTGLGFNFTKGSTSETKQVNFVKSQKVESK